MFTNKFIPLLLMIAVLGCDNSQKVSVVIDNDSNLSRKDEPITIPKEKLTGFIGDIADNLVPLLKDPEGNPLPSQADDMDGDGKWDALFFLVNVDAKSTREITVSFVQPDQLPPVKQLAHDSCAEAKPPFKPLNHTDRLTTNHTRFTDLAFQMEGPAWENDVVAFRNYFDARNGMDIFGKRTPEMVMDGVDTGGGPAASYHKLQAWGMDILKVGNSLGAGAIALKAGDNYHRIDSAMEAKCHLIADGPLRAVFDLTFKGWQAAGNSYDVLHRISIWGGANFYQSQVTLSGIKGSEKLVSGIVNMHSDTLLTVDNKEVVSIATHDNQAFDGEKLGMAIMVKKADFAQSSTAPDEGEGIIQTYCAEMNVKNEQPVTFRFYAGWEVQNPQFTAWENFKSLLEKEAEKWGNPVAVTLK